MSFQAYLDAVETSTGRTPRELIDLARLEHAYGLGRGHGMAMVHVITKGLQISDKHVGAAGAHGDDSNVLRLDGMANR
ncbi:MAG: DUF4287 domain-containing protein [Thermoleophilia bacterium]|nr:DUF4287 domain-containing protein [Thermoleophilia bacterium]